MKMNARIKTFLKAGMLSMAVLFCTACLLLFPDKTLTTPSPDDATCLQVGCVAPNFKLSTISGETAQLQQWRGRPLLLNFWTSWCGYCRQEMPYLQEIFSEYRDTGLVVVGVNDEETQGEVEAYIAQFGLTFPVLLDPDGDVGRIYQVKAFPTSYFIDAQGVIQNVQVGSMSKGEMVGILLTNLAIALPRTATSVSPPIASTPLSSLEKMILGCVTTKSLRVRAGPGMNYVVIGGLAQGDCRFFDGRNANNTWVRLARDSLGKKGERMWAAAGFIRFEESIDALPVLEP